MKQWKLDTSGYWVTGAGCQIEKSLKHSHNPRNGSKDFSKMLYLSIYQVWWLNELWFERSIQKCTLSYVLILVMTSEILYIMGWLKIQKLEYLKNGIELFYETKNFWEIIVL